MPMPMGLLIRLLCNHDTLLTMSGNKLLLGAFLTSSTYLSYKLYEKLAPKDQIPSEDENYLILKRMNERFQSGHLQSTPFPTYLKMGGLECGANESEKRRISLCESIQLQLERDWNCFLFRTSKFILK